VKVRVFDEMRSALERHAGAHREGTKIFDIVRGAIGEYLERQAAELVTLEALSAKARKLADARRAAAKKQAARKHAA
jgi:hypothetical protein